MVYEWALAAEPHLPLAGWASARPYVRVSFSERVTESTVYVGGRSVALAHTQALSLVAAREQE